MSEDFDKEAEREKLRKKYERDQKKREATEQMSELLLQGATMTNAHCSECGDPIFRYDGQEFCPTCEKSIDRGGDAEDAEDQDDGEQIEVTSPDSDTRVAFGSQEQDSAQEKQDQPPVDTPAESQGTADQSPNSMPARSAGTETPDSPQPGHGQQPEQNQPEQQPPQNQLQQQAPQPHTQRPLPERREAASIDAGYDALVEALTKFSREAAATDDPRRAEEHLSAAREAAEALDALRR